MPLSRAVFHEIMPYLREFYHEIMVFLGVVYHEIPFFKDFDNGSKTARKTVEHEARFHKVNVVSKRVAYLYIRACVFVCAEPYRGSVRSVVKSSRRADRRPFRLSLKRFYQSYRPPRVVRAFSLCGYLLEKIKNRLVALTNL